MFSTRFKIAAIVFLAMIVLGGGVLTSMDARAKRMSAWDEERKKTTSVSILISKEALPYLEGKPLAFGAVLTFSHIPRGDGKQDVILCVS